MLLIVFILLPSLLNIFTVIALETLPGRLLISTLLLSSGLLLCSIIWNMFLCHLILPNSLFLLLFIRWNAYVSHT